MYYAVMGAGKSGIRLDRIEEEMIRCDYDSKTLARIAGVSEAAISKLLNEKSPGMSAVNLSSIAAALKVSLDYLMGMTDDPLPKTLTREELIIELVQLAQSLTNRRRRDLIDTARAYLESAEEVRGNPKRLAENLVDYITEAGGKTSSDQLLKYLLSDEWEDGDDSSGTLPPDDGNGPADDEE